MLESNDDVSNKKDLARTARSLSEELADTTAAALSARTDPVIDAHWDDRDMAFLQRVARSLVEAAPETRGLLTATRNGDVLFVVVAGEDANTDLGVVGPRVAAAPSFRARQARSLAVTKLSKC